MRIRARGRLSSIPAAQQRLRSAELKLADARANPSHIHHFSRLEDDLEEARRLLEVAHKRAEADKMRLGGNTPK
jgi:hypothetical protein